mgnify:CR=1 FL=1
MGEPIRANELSLQTPNELSGHLNARLTECIFLPSFDP